MTTIQIRTQDKTKKNAQRILKKLGMDLSTAINLYLVKIIVTESIPFRIVTENGMTPEYEEEILKDIASARRSKKTYASAREAHEAIMRGE